MRPALTARARQKAAWQAQFRQTRSPAQAAPIAQPGLIDVHIAELAFRGWPRGSERQIASAFERELGRLVARELPQAWAGATKTIALRAEMRLRSARNPVSVGEQLAAAVLHAREEERP